LSGFAEQALDYHLGISVPITHLGQVSGGDINEALRIDTAQERYFLKYNDADRYPGMMEFEAAGLDLLRKHSSFRIPEVLGYGILDGKQYLLLEWLSMGGSSMGAWEQAGHHLAELHAHSSDAFGLDLDNYIGRLPQSNKRHDRLSDFYRAERLEPQLRMALSNGLMGSSDADNFQKLYAKLDELLPEDSPSLIHGDLWSGNISILRGDVVSIYDPAVYYGHGEQDLAMSRLFGRFPEVFYSAYEESGRLSPGWEERVELWNLYPLLVHLNLFGTSYLSSVRDVLNTYL